MHGIVCTDWSGKSNNCKSPMGIILCLTGRTILCRTKFQACVATSSTEAEFTAVYNTGKSILYVRSILDEIDLPRDFATTLFVENNGALMMGNTQQPTRRTKHIATKKLTLQDWIQRYLLVMKHISSSDNNYNSDAIATVLGRQLHYHHND